MKPITVEDIQRMRYNSLRYGPEYKSGGKISNKDLYKAQSYAAGGDILTGVGAVGSALAGPLAMSGVGLPIAAAVAGVGALATWGGNKINSADAKRQADMQSLPPTYMGRESYKGATFETGGDLDTEYARTKQLYEREKARVEKVRANILKKAQEKSKKDNPSTRTNLSWINEDDRYFCNSHTCEIIKDSSATISKPISNLNQRSYDPGSIIPLIPGNMQWDSYADKLGFEWVDNPEPGDLARHRRIVSETPQGTSVGKSEQTVHSMIYSGDGYYHAPGGARNKFVFDPKDQYQMKEGDVVKYQRYVGNLPALETKLKTLEKERGVPDQLESKGMSSIPTSQKMPEMKNMQNVNLPPENRKFLGLFASGGMIKGKSHEAGGETGMVELTNGQMVNVGNNEVEGREYIEPTMDGGLFVYPERYGYKNGEIQEVKNSKSLSTKVSILDRVMSNMERKADKTGYMSPETKSTAKVIDTMKKHMQRDVNQFRQSMMATAAKYDVGGNIPPELIQAANIAGIGQNLVERYMSGDMDMTDAMYTQVNDFMNQYHSMLANAPVDPGIQIPQDLYDIITNSTGLSVDDVNNILEGNPSALMNINPNDIDKVNQYLVQYSNQQAGPNPLGIEQDFNINSLNSLFSGQNAQVPQATSPQFPGPSALAQDTSVPPTVVGTFPPPPPDVDPPLNAALMNIQSMPELYINRLESAVYDPLFNTGKLPGGTAGTAPSIRQQAVPSGLPPRSTTQGTTTQIDPSSVTANKVDLTTLAGLQSDMARNNMGMVLSQAPSVLSRAVDALSPVELTTRRFVTAPIPERQIQPNQGLREINVGQNTVMQGLANFRSPQARTAAQSNIYGQTQATRSNYLAGVNQANMQLLAQSDQMRQEQARTNTQLAAQYDLYDAQARENKRLARQELLDSLSTVGTQYFQAQNVVASDILKSQALANMV